MPGLRTLGHDISHTVVLCFNTRPRGSVLAFGGAGDEAILEGHGIAQGELVCVTTIVPFNVRVDNPIGLY